VTDILNTNKGEYLNNTSVEDRKNQTTTGWGYEYGKVNKNDYGYKENRVFYELDPNLVNAVRARLTELGVDGPNQDKEREIY